MMENRSTHQWPHADRWLSVDEIGAYLGIKRDTVYKWISERQMPGHKIGRLWKFNRQEVDEWVRRGGANTTPPSQKTSEAEKRESRWLDSKK